MDSGSKSRVWVGFGSGTKKGVFCLPDHIPTDGFGWQKSGLGTISQLRVRLPKKVGFFPRVLGFRVPEHPSLISFAIHNNEENCISLSKIEIRHHHSFVLIHKIIFFVLQNLPLGVVRQMGFG